LLCTSLLLSFEKFLLSEDNYCITVFKDVSITLFYFFADVYIPIYVISAQIVKVPTLRLQHVNPKPHNYNLAASERDKKINLAGNFSFIGILYPRTPHVVFII
jgi:hypothetical protein